MRSKVLSAAVGLALLAALPAQATLSTAIESRIVIIEQPLLQEAGLMSWPAYRACMMNQIRSAMNNLAGRHSVEIVLDMSSGICMDILNSMMN